MVTEYPGNAIPAPGFYAGGDTVDLELMYSMHNYVQKGVTLKPGQGVLKTGTVLARDEASKRYVKYNAAGSGGAQKAVGILRKTVDTGSSDKAQVFLGNILYAGLVKLPLVREANGNIAVADLVALFPGSSADEHAAGGTFFRFG